MIAALQRWRAAVQDARGVALIEFALVLPILLVLYLGSVQLQDGIACNRKVTIATRAAADLIAQNASGTTTSKQIDDSLAAAAQVLAPYRSDRAVIRLTQITVDHEFRFHIDWSRARNGAPDTVAALSDLPNEMRIPGLTVLFARVTYDYRPPSNFGFIKPILLRDHLVMLPRNSTSITCSDCHTS